MSTLISVSPATLEVPDGGQGSVIVSIASRPSPTPSGVVGAHISLVDQSGDATVARTLGPLSAALQRFVTEHVAPAWGTPAVITVDPTPPPSAWPLYLLPTSDYPGALGYHDLTADDVPEAKVFVQDTLQAGLSVSSVASHELAELLVDPYINLLAEGGVTAIPPYAYEVADPVEADEFGLDGFSMSNFVLPAWFEDANRVGPWDALGRTRGPFLLAPGGYASVLEGGSWTQVFGATVAGRRSVDRALDRGMRSRRVR